MLKFKIRQLILLVIMTLPTLGWSGVSITTNAVTSRSICFTVESTNIDPFVDLKWNETGVIASSSYPDFRLNTSTNQSAFIGSFCITGLSPNTNYDINASTKEPASSTIQQKTKPAIVFSSGSTTINSTTATIDWSLSNNYSNTTITLEYGTTTNYGTSINIGTIAATLQSATFSKTLASLQAATTYHYRIKANSPVDGTAYGTDQTFTTMGVQSISLSATDTKTARNAPYSVGASVTSNLPLTYVSSDTNIAKINTSGIIQIKQIGQTTITVSQAGNSSYDPAITKTQTLTVTIDTTMSPVTGTYLISNLNSGLFLSSKQGTTQRSTRGLIENRWLLQRIVNSNAFLLVNKATGLALTSTLPITSSALTYSTPDTSSKLQRWKVKYVGLGYNLIVNESSGLALNVSLGSKLDGGTVIQYTEETGSNSRWTFLKLPELGYQKPVVVSIQNHMASLKDSIASLGDTAISQNGFCIGTTGTALTLYNADIKVNSSSDKSAVAFQGANSLYTGNQLQANQTYYARSFLIAGSDTIYGALTSSFKTLTSQVITFDHSSNYVKTIGDPDFTISASSNSNLPVTITSSDTNVATVVNGVVHIKATGATTFKATQSGNSTYELISDYRILWVRNIPSQVAGWGGNSHILLNSPDANAANPVRGKDASGNLIRGVVDMNLNLNFKLALHSDGSVWAWGSNSEGQLGNNSINYSTQPVQVVDDQNKPITDVVAISSGMNQAFALKSDGTLWTWGNNSISTYNGTQTHAVPVRDAFDNPMTGVVSIFNLSFNAYALKSDGTVWAWGNNQEGQIGNNTTTNINRPTQVSDLQGAPLTQVKQISATLNNCIALKTDGTVWAWGNNTSGQLGNNSTVKSSHPVQVVQLNNITSVDIEHRYGMALKSDSTVWTWGSNIFGQLGNKTTTTSLTPVQVVDVQNKPLTKVTNIKCLPSTSAALRSDGSIYIWGQNSEGAFGITDITDQFIPYAKQVPGIQASAIIKSNNTFTTLGTYVLYTPPSVEQISPNQGSLTGQNAVMLSGKGLGCVKQVKFGANSAGFNINDNRVIALVPPGSTAGSVDVQVVTNLDDTSAVDNRSQYTYKNDQAIRFASTLVRTYGNPDFDPGATAGQGLNVSYESSDTNTASVINGKLHIKQVGTSIITANQLGDASTLPASPQNAFLVVNPATITVTADAKSKVYGSVDSPLSFSTSGLIGTDTLEGALVRTNGESVGMYPISQGSLGSKNYHINFTPAIFSITPAQLTITGVTAKDKTYDGKTTATLTAGSLIGLVNNETANLIQGSGVFADANAGTGKTVTANGFGVIWDGSAIQGNYILPPHPTSLKADINKAPLTITVADASKAVGAADPTFTYTSTALVNGEKLVDVLKNPKITREAGTNAGTYKITLTTTADNYALTIIAGTLTITKATGVIAHNDRPEFTGMAKATIVDMQGRLAWSGELYVNGGHFSLPSIGAGQWIIKLRMGNDVVVETRIVK